MTRQRRILHLSSSREQRRKPPRDGGATSLKLLQERKSVRLRATQQKRKKKIAGRANTFSIIAQHSNFLSSAKRTKALPDGTQKTNIAKRVQRDRQREIEDKGERELSRLRYTHQNYAKKERKTENASFVREMIFIQKPARRHRLRLIEREKETTVVQRPQ
jgi:hypothetical protein